MAKDNDGLNTTDKAAYRDLVKSYTRGTEVVSATYNGTISKVSGHDGMTGRPLDKIRALRSILEPDGGFTAVQSLAAKVQSLKELITSPDMYVRERKHDAEFHGIVLSTISKEIKELRKTATYPLETVCAALKKETGKSHPRILSSEEPSKASWHDLLKKSVVDKGGSPHLWKQHITCDNVQEVLAKTGYKSHFNSVINCIESARDKSRTSAI